MKAVILTEGGQKIGFGHITRCEALCSALHANGFQTTFAVNGDSSVKKQFKGRIDYVLNWLYNARRLNHLLRKAQAVIIDSYLAPKNIYDLIAKNVPAPVYVDDYLRLPYPRGTVLNGGIGTEKLDYPRMPGVSYLLGIKYALLRKEFWHIRPHRTRKIIQDLLLTFGGIDHFDLVKSLLCHLRAKHPEVFFHVIVPGNRCVRYRAVCRDISRAKFYIKLGAAEMRNLMLKCDVAISGGGQTLNELSRCGLPTIGICLASNQKHHLREWQRCKLVTMAGHIKSPNIISRVHEKLNTLSYCRRQSMTKFASKLVDGGGPQRVVEFLKKILKGA
ncbi:MAG: hypothetical protein WC530_01460 [Candidatus Omnitrophota bacterium]|jgi:spore coat polysaccharide biosynthesis predicted glycosyltransferase SpsG